MHVRERFATKGYVVFYGAVHDDTINVWRSIARQTDGWFYDEMNDGFFGFFDDEANMTEERVRVKVVLPDQDARGMSRLLKRFYRTIFPDASAHNWHLIMTPAGTEDQPPRREFLTVPLGADIMDTSALPGSIVVATNDDTCFYAYGWNERFALRSNRKLLELNKGDIVLSVETSFSRLSDDHRPTVVTEIDDTRGIDDPSCIVWNSTFKGTPLSLRRHLNRSHGIRFQRAARHLEP
ncbi:hypothetical protein PR001_g27066 [Phytophthora rubi]|uniref:Uncharacterized protein n=1 Tax=Phytophthora rubi TaxID=129364 RepID=A0A6A3HQE1_9STRA|nr:hypothetical protein PR001_g27066 [Phytophthora rubi]KAE8971796.1 hypothetical protein PR002_g26712 [Phytophthora rubi]